MLLLQARVDMGAMAIKGYSYLPKAPALLEPHHPGHLLVGVQSVYSTVPADRANFIYGKKF